MTVNSWYQLPSGWETKPTKYGFAVLNGSTPSSSEQSYWDGDIHWATPEDIGSLRGRVLRNTRRKITEAGYDHSGTQIAPEGSIILTTRAPVGNLALSGIPLCTNQGCKTLVPRSKKFDSGYFYYQFLARKEELGALAAGTTFQELGTEELRAFEIWIPSISEQCAIADFLDRETAKIDELIAEKERLLELLAEKRRALITHTVTRGLDSDVPMRNSGVEWLGEIPAHWKTMKIKHVAKVGNGSTPLRDNEDYWKGGSFPWLTSTVVNDAIVGEPTEFVTETALRKCHLPVVQPDSVLIAITGEGKTRGKAAWLRYSATINQHLAFISPQKDLLEPEFLQLTLSASYGILRMISEGTGSTKGALTCEQVGEFLIPLPPLAEQRKIIAAVSSVKARVDVLAEGAEELIVLLQERRTALISAAVTGRVRTEVES